MTLPFVSTLRATSLGLLSLTALLFGCKSEEAKPTTPIDVPFIASMTATTGAAGFSAAAPYAEMTQASGTTDVYITGTAADGRSIGITIKARNMTQLVDTFITQQIFTGNLGINTAEAFSTEANGTEYSTRRTLGVLRPGRVIISKIDTAKKTLEGSFEFEGTAATTTQRVTAGAFKVQYRPTLYPVILPAYCFVLNEPTGRSVWTVSTSARGSSPNGPVNNYTLKRTIGGNDQMSLRILQSRTGDQGLTAGAGFTLTIGTTNYASTDPSLTTNPDERVRIFVDSYTTQLSRGRVLEGNMAMGANRRIRVSGFWNLVNP